MDHKVFKIKSPAFKDGKMIPDRFAKYGENISPPVSWENPPMNTQELVLLCEDPDSTEDSPFIHWAAYHISPGKNALEENAAQTSIISHGKNSAGTNSYAGLRPGSGVHRYYFRLFAINKVLDLEQGASLNDLMRAIHGHVIGRTETMGRFKHK